MKNRVLRLAVCILALGFASLAAPAQTKQISHDVSSFDCLDVDFDFDVRVVEARKPSVSLNVDNELKDLVQTYVKNHTLYITLDQKKLPSDLRKLFKSRRSKGPVLEATVYISEPLTAVKLAGASILTVTPDIECKEFRIDLEDNARIERLTVDAGTVTVNASDKSFADIVLYADEIKINSSGSSVIGLDQDSEKLAIVAGGSSEVRMEGETLDADLTVSGTSKATLAGKTNKLAVTGSGFTNVDAINLKASECTAKLSGNCKVYEAATETIHVDISGNSTLVFDGDPVVDIISVKSSTLQRYNNAKR